MRNTGICYSHTGDDQTWHTLPAAIGLTVIVSLFTVEAMSFIARPLMDFSDSLPWTLVALFISLSAAVLMALGGVVLIMRTLNRHGKIEVAYSILAWATILCIAGFVLYYALLAATYMFVAVWSFWWSMFPSMQYWDLREVLFGVFAFGALTLAATITTFAAMIAFVVFLWKRED